MSYRLDDIIGTFRKKKIALDSNLKKLKKIILSRNTLKPTLSLILYLGSAARVFIKQ